jgi:hypothetical protein
MSNEKKYSILFVLNKKNKALEATLPNICSGLIKMGHEVHVIYSLHEENDEFEVTLRKVPWIHARRLFIPTILDAAWATVPFAIRQYIKKHDGMDVIHSFGLCCGVLSCPAGFASQSITINTPDEIIEIAPQGAYQKFIKFVIDNISYISNRLQHKIIFCSENDQSYAAKLITFKNVTTDCVEFSADSTETCQKLVRIYEAAIDAKKKQPS